MLLLQIHTKKRYELTAEEWARLGARQKLFKVLSTDDAKPVKQQVENTIKSQSQSRKNNTNKETTSKNKK